MRTPIRYLQGNIPLIGPLPSYQARCADLMPVAIIAVASCSLGGGQTCLMEQVTLAHAHTSTSSRRVRFIRFPFQLQVSPWRYDDAMCSGDVLVSGVNEGFMLLLLQLVPEPVVVMAICTRKVRPSSFSYTSIV